MMDANRGPDQLIATEELVSTEPHKAVKLLIGAGWPETLEPISVPSLLMRTAHAAPNQLAMMVKRDNEWLSWSYAQYLHDSETVAKAFIKLGLQPHHSVGILGFNSPEWFLSDMGAVFAGGIATGIYATNSAEAVKYIADHCRANILVVEDEKQLDKVMPFRHELPHLKAVVQFLGTPRREGVLSWEDLMELGRQQPYTELVSRLERVAINRCCHLVYTSGTTGMPKGVMLSHDNLIFTAKMLVDTYQLKDREERLVSYLPLSHVAANLLDIFVMMACQGTVYFADKDALKGTLTDTLKYALPTLFFGVPRVWEKIQEKMVAIGKENKGLKLAIGSWAKKTGLAHNRNLVNGGMNTSSLGYRIANKVVFQKVKADLGFSKCLRFFVAAAPISTETLEYFMSLDIRLLDIYGLSECTGPQTLNTHQAQRIGTIGRSMQGLHTRVDFCTEYQELEVAEYGQEIMMRGRNVMMGYLFDQSSTANVFSRDGWLRSGDLGEEQSDGFFCITGRIKEIIVTAGGENIPPVLIEHTIKSHLPCLSNVMLIGDRRKFLCCLLTLKTEVDPDTLIPTSDLAPAALEWCASIGSKAKTVEDVLGSQMDGAAAAGPDLLVMKAIQEGIDRANQHSISHAQKVQKWLLLRQDFSVPGGELGPTMKIRRHAVLHKYNDIVEKFYK